MNVRYKDKSEINKAKIEKARKKRMQAFVPEHDINKYCSKCKYRTVADNLHAETAYDKVVKRKPREHRWCCGYALIRKESCLKRINGEIVDTRGPGPGCKLFEPGDPKREDPMRAAGQQFDYGRW